MRITPLDVRKQEFRKVVRGFDAEEVMAFLATVADEYEAVLVDNKKLRERIMDLDEKMTEYHTMETTLRDTLMTAERVMSEAKDNAAKEADLIIRDAELRSQQVTEAFNRQAADLRREIIALHKEKEAYLARFKGLAEAQIQFVDNHQTDFEQLDCRLMDLAQNISVERSTEPAPSPPPPTIASDEKPPPGSRESDEWRNYTPDLSFLRRKSRSSIKPEEAQGQEAAVDETLSPSESQVTTQEPVPMVAEPDTGPEESPVESVIVEPEADTSPPSTESSLEPHPSSQSTVSSAAALSLPEMPQESPVAAFPPAGNPPEARPWDMDRFADDLRHT